MAKKSPANGLTQIIHFRENIHLIYERKSFNFESIDFKYFFTFSLYIDMDQRKCIVHYDIKNTKYSDIKEISSVNMEKIYWAKSICESLGGKNHYTDQCQLIPEEFDPVEHGIHLVPRCKKFTLILSKETDRSSGNSNNESLLTEPRPKRVKTSHVSNVYHKECNFCKKYRTMKKNKIHFPKTLCTDKAVQTIKDAAESKENQSLYFEIKDADLIAGEFKYNENCYKEYTRKKF